MSRSEPQPDLGTLKRRVEALSSRIEVVEEQNEWLEDQLKERDQEIERLEERLDDYERRSELLDNVLQSDNSTRKRRAAILLQTLYNDSMKSNGSASIDARAGRDILNRTVERTTVYNIFEDAVDAVGNEDVCHIKRESRASKKNTRLILEPENGALPSNVAGISLKEGAD